MSPWRILKACLLVALLPVPLRAEDSKAQADWPQFRGRGASGIGDGLSAPLSWDVEKAVNLRWKTRIPGLGHACPIITGERVFVLTAISGDPNTPLRVGLYGDIAPVKDPTKHSWRLVCLDRNQGAKVWERTVHEGVPKIKRHTKSTHANSTPATDGSRLVVFLGSEGLYCYDLEGKLLWKKDLGLLDSGYYRVPPAQWAFGSSPIIYRQTVIVQCDVQKNSFLAAFQLKDGKEIWRTSRNDVPTWSTPSIHEGPKRTQLIVNGHRHMGGYDPRTGKELWRLRGGGDIPVPTPIVADGLIYLTNGHGRPSPIFAVRLNAVGDVSLKDGAVSNQHVAWAKGRGGAYMQTPLAYRGHVWVSTDSGILSCFEARTGELRYRQRLGAGAVGFTASPVAADGRVYFTSEEGEVQVIEAGPVFRRLATNSLGEVCMATPAITKGMMVFRTRDHVVAVGESSKPQ